MSAMNDGGVLQAATSPAASQLGAAATRRANWMRQVTLWHWVSSAIALIGMLFFALTGITLNHAELFENGTAKITHQSAVLPPAVLATVNGLQESADNAVPTALKAWLSETWRLAVYPKGVELGPDEVFIDLKHPGVDASLTIDRHSGAIDYEVADRGWVAYFNELHRGRNAGGVWSVFITVFGVACVIFSVTGLLMLQVRARGRWSVWPITGLGLIVPLLLMLLFVH